MSLGEGRRRNECENEKKEGGGVEGEEEEETAAAEEAEKAHQRLEMLKLKMRDQYSNVEQKLDLVPEHRHTTATR